jgi:hypothetical protein
MYCNYKSYQNNTNVAIKERPYVRDTIFDNYSNVANQFVARKGVASGGYTYFYVPQDTVIFIMTSNGVVGTANLSALTGSNTSITVSTTTSTGTDIIHIKYDTASKIAYVYNKFSIAVDLYLIVMGQIG